MDASWVDSPLALFLPNRQTIQKMKPKWPGQEREPQMTHPFFRGVRDVAGLLLGDFFLFKAEFSEWNKHQPVFWG